MKAYLLHDSGPDGRLYLAFGEDCCAAARSVIAKIGGNPDVNRFSVGGSYAVSPDEAIDVSKWWPYFTTDPDRPSAVDIIQGKRRPVADAASKENARG